MVDIDMSLNYCYFLVLMINDMAKVSKKSVKSNVFIYFFPIFATKIANDSIFLAITQTTDHEENTRNTRTADDLRTRIVCRQQRRHTAAKPVHRY
jgi:hypothetical protein